MHVAQRSQPPFFRQLRVGGALFSSGRALGTGGGSGAEPPWQIVAVAMVPLVRARLLDLFDLSCGCGSQNPFVARSESIQFFWLFHASALKTCGDFQSKSGRAALSKIELKIELKQMCGF